VERDEHHELSCLLQRFGAVYDRIIVVGTASAHELTHGTRTAGQSSSNTVPIIERSYDTPYDRCR